jgi:hypothetical protein
MQERSLVVAFLAVLSGCGTGVLEGDPPSALPSGTLEIADPLTLSASTLEPEAALTAFVTYRNAGSAPFTVEDVAIEVIPPGGTREAGPFQALSPTVGSTTVQPGEKLPVRASRSFTEADALGTWEAYSVVRDHTGQRFTGPSVFFERRRRDPLPTPDAGTPPPDAGTPPSPPDAGTPPPDAGTPPPDAGTPPPDAGTLPPPGTIVEPINPGPGDVTFTVRADSDVHAISPLIYGINQQRDFTTNQRGVGLLRGGGNRWTAYNWENNASSAGADYLNQNDNFLMSGLPNASTPGEAVRARAAYAMANGAAMLVTIPIQGYAAADKLGNGDVNQTANYLQTRFKQVVARKNAPFSLTPDTTDAYVYQDEFANWLKTQFPTAFSGASSKILFSLDNEPDLWADTHPRIQPAPVTPAELISKTIDFAGATKAVIPNAMVAGFVSYGFNGYVNLQDTYSGSDFTAYFLDQLRLAGVSAGKRLLDVLDLHWYSEVTADGSRITGSSTTANSVTARVQAPRSLWDPTYTENSWIASYTGGPIQLIPAMKARIAAHYPGTKLGFSEYSYGGGGHISGAIAEADVLGIFGREDVYLANYWEMNASSDFIYAAMRTFTSYDEAGAHFGDTSVRATTSNAVNTSVYASIDAANPGRMVLVAINKTGAPVTASISLAAYGTYTTARVYQLTGASTTIQPAASVSATTRNGFFYAMPAYSVSVLVPQ